MSWPKVVYQKSRKSVLTNSWNYLHCFNISAEIHTTMSQWNLLKTLQQMQSSYTGSVSDVFFSTKTAFNHVFLHNHVHAPNFFLP